MRTMTLVIEYRGKDFTLKLKNMSTVRVIDDASGSYGIFITRHYPVYSFTEKRWNVSAIMRVVEAFTSGDDIPF